MDGRVPHAHVRLLLLFIPHSNSPALQPVDQWRQSDNHPPHLTLGSRWRSTNNEWQHLIDIIMFLNLSHINNWSHLSPVQSQQHFIHLLSIVARQQKTSQGWNISLSEKSHRHQDVSLTTGKTTFSPNIIWGPFIQLQGKCCLSRI